jgi:hypothetical protein
MLVVVAVLQIVVPGHSLEVVGVVARVGRVLLSLEQQALQIEAAVAAAVFMYMREVQAVPAS